MLDRGLIVTRLELALYVEKAQNQLDAGTPVPSTAPVAPLPAAPAPLAPASDPAPALPAVPGAPAVPEDQFAAPPALSPAPPATTAPVAAPAIATAPVVPATAPAVTAPAPQPAVVAPAAPATLFTPSAPAPAPVVKTAVVESNPNDLSLAPEAPTPVLKEAAMAQTPGTAQNSVSVYSGPYVATTVSAALKKKIATLRRALREESEFLTTRLALDDQRIADQAAELDKLRTAQDDVEGAYRKANKLNGSTHLTYESDLRVENLQITGPLAFVSATRTKEEANIGLWADLGGKGSINLGIDGTVYDANASSGPGSIYVSSPSVNYELDGMLGKWNSTVAVEYYNSDTDLGDFTRGSSPGALRYEDPFDLKKYSGDKNQKNWDDYITNLTYVPSFTSWSNSNNSQKVFDGLYMVGTQLPLVSKDAKITFLVGRVEKDASKWEEGLKYTQPWFDGHLQTSFSAEWVNQNYGAVASSSVSLTPVMDQKNYAADFGIDLKPVFLDVEGGFSHFYTGLWTPQMGVTVNGQAPLTFEAPNALEAPAGQASLNIYPLTLYYTAISDNYLNTQSKVILSGFNLARYGYAPYSPVADSQAGFVGMVDDLISDRYGWRANLGWKGRQEGWMKDWPDFLDDIVVNFDAAQKTEYSVILDEAGANAIEAYQLVSVYYPEDNGLWGDTWSGFGGIGSMGKSYINNIETLRNLGGSNSPFYNDTLFAGNSSTQRIPFIMPVYSSPGVIETNSSGYNVYNYLDHLKTFNYITLTTKFQFNKMMEMKQPFYGGFFFTDHQVSGVSTNPLFMNMPDPNRPGATLGQIPNLFEQTVYDGSLFYQLMRNVNLLADYGVEFWKSNYTYPLVDYRTDAIGAGVAYDVPWGGSKLEAHYKHITFQDADVPLNNYQADQLYVYFLMQF